MILRLEGIREMINKWKKRRIGWWEGVSVWIQKEKGWSWGKLDAMDAKKAKWQKSCPLFAMVNGHPVSSSWCLPPFWPETEKKKNLQQIPFSQERHATLISLYIWIVSRWTWMAYLVSVGSEFAAERKKVVLTSFSLLGQLQMIPVLSHPIQSPYFPSWRIGSNSVFGP